MFYVLSSEDQIILNSSMFILDKQENGAYEGTSEFFDVCMMLGLKPFPFLSPSQQEDFKCFLELSDKLYDLTQEIMKHPCTMYEKAGGFEKHKWRADLKSILDAGLLVKISNYIELAEYQDSAVKNVSYLFNVLR